MKTVEELAALKEELETMNKKLAELSDEELEQVAGGLIPCYPIGLIPIVPIDRGGTAAKKNTTE